MVPRQLKRNLEFAQRIKCPREHNFLEMYGQDEEEQHKVRELHANKNHCRFLKDSCRACDELPYDIGDTKAGEACPNNPFFRLKDLLGEQEESSEVIREAQVWESLIELNRMPEEMTAVQFTFASVIKKFADVKSMMNQGLMMFGGGTTTTETKPELPKFRSR
jgi:hypothetical protein